MNIREIEEIIDTYHVKHPFLNGTKEQMTYEILSVFQKLCSDKIASSILNPFALQKITDYMDAVTQALSWIEHSHFSNISSEISDDISEERYEEGRSFLCEYALPYSQICSGYISFSRNRFSAKVEDNSVIFDISEGENNTFYTDIIREIDQKQNSLFMDFINPMTLSEAFLKFQKEINTTDGVLSYSINEDMLEPFIKVTSKHWEYTKTLPNTWKFDEFTINEYRDFWITITAICYFHLFSCIYIENSLIELKNSLMNVPKEMLINTVSYLSKLNPETINKIIKYITFEPTKRNVDIVYQPIVEYNGKVLITPVLFIASNPERNLLSLVNSRKDYEHSKEVNDLENLMVSEIETAIPNNENLILTKHRHLENSLPDLDLGIFDKKTNTALLCELKWFTAADSTKEVYAREDEITHGCNQMESIMSYAMCNKKSFIKKVFDLDEDDVELFCCVIAKHNIRTKNNHVPVINLKTLIDLFSSQSIINIFHIIRNREFETHSPTGISFTHKTVKYGDYIFKIPAICFE